MPGERELGVYLQDDGRKASRFWKRTHGEGKELRRKNHELNNYSEVA